MSSNSKTPNLGLPQWVLSDPPQMTDFNNAFLSIDNFAGTKGKANGVATLDSGAKVPVPQIPAANSLQVLNLGPIPTSDRLQTGQDLNNYITPGSYWCTTKEIAGSLLNCPYYGRFKLVVDKVSSGGEIIYQYLIPGHTSYDSVYTIYYRVYDIWGPASPWGDWKTLLSVVDGNEASIQKPPLFST